MSPLSGPDKKDRMIKSIFGFLISLCLAFTCHGQELTASWYSMESIILEGSSGIMANGEKLNDEEFTCASRDHDFGDHLRVTNMESGKSVTVRVTDRGPAWRLYRKGRKIDLSKRAFAEIADLEQGIIPVKIERWRG